MALVFPLSVALSSVTSASCAGNPADTKAPVPAATPVAVPTARPTAVPVTISGMKPLAKSTLIAELASVGLDVNKLPPLKALNVDQNKKVMATFAQALGWTCADCHGTKRSFDAPTELKRVASHMWNDYVRGLASTDGGGLYCDSCHLEKSRILVRKDKVALAAWMDAEYTKKLKRRDGQEHSCSTCHGDPFEAEVIAGFKK